MSFDTRSSRLSHIRDITTIPKGLGLPPASPIPAEVVSARSMMRQPNADVVASLEARVVELEARLKALAVWHSSGRSEERLISTGFASCAASAHLFLGPTSGRNTMFDFHVIAAMNGFRYLTTIE